VFAEVVSSSDLREDLGLIPEAGSHDAALKDIQLPCKKAETNDKNVRM
jgi:hypothetical protein